MSIIKRSFIFVLCGLLICCAYVIFIKQYVKPVLAITNASSVSKPFPGLIVNCNETKSIIARTLAMHRIKKFEGLRLTRYEDSVTKKPLQGYGRNVTGKKTPNTICEDTANAWLSEDIDKCIKLLDENLVWWRNLNIARQAAIIDLCYNLGMNKLLTFEKFIEHLQNENYEDASNELLFTDGKKTKYSKQVGIRAIEISQAIQNGYWTVHKM